MDLKTYLQRKNIPPTRWARENGIPAPVISRYLRGVRGLSIYTARKIVEATNGEVGYEDIVKDVKAAPK